jgi:hypothetical protein
MVAMLQFGEVVNVIPFFDGISVPFEQLRVWKLLIINDQDSSSLSDFIDRGLGPLKAARPVEEF